MRCGDVVPVLRRRPRFPPAEGRRCRRGPVVVALDGRVELRLDVAAPQCNPTRRRAGSRRSPRRGACGRLHRPQPVGARAAAAGVPRRRRLCRFGICRPCRRRIGCWLGLRGCGSAGRRRLRLPELRLELVDVVWGRFRPGARGELRLELRRVARAVAAALREGRAGLRCTCGVRVPSSGLCGPIGSRAECGNTWAGGHAWQPQGREECLGRADRHDRRRAPSLRPDAEVEPGERPRGEP